MADAQKTIDLIFNGVDKTGAATLSALNNAKSFTSSLQNVTQPIADFTAGALKLEAGLLAAGLAVAVFAVKVAGDFDTAFREIATLISVPIGELDEFRKAIDKYASTSTKPLAEVTQAIYNAISAGVPYAQSIEFVTQAEKLAVAGKADLNAATVVLIGSLNAYGKGAESAAEFSDALFQTVKLGQTTLPELANSLSMVTSAAATLEIPFDTLLAAIATLTSVGMPTAQAVTAINAAMTALIKPSAEATKLAAELGIEFGAQAVKSKGLEVVLADVARATGGNVEQMAKLFGSSESLKAVLPLVGAAAAKFGKDLADMGNKAGVVQTAFDIMAKSIDASQQKVINAFNGMMGAVGTPLLDEFGGIAQAIAGIFTALGDSVKDGALKDLVAYIESQFGSIQRALETVAKNLPAALASADFSGFKGGLDAVLGALKSMFGAIDITTVEGLKDMIELAGTAFFGLSKYVAGVIQVFAPLFETLVDVGKGLKDVDLSFIQIIGNIGGVASALNLVLPLFTGLLAVLTAKQTIGLVSSLREIAPVIGTLVTGPVSVAALGTAFALAGYNLGKELNPHIDTFISKLAGQKTTLGGWIYDLVHGADESKKLGLSSGDAAAGVGKLGDAVNKAGNAGEVAKGFGELDAALVKASDASRVAQGEFRKSEISIQNSTEAVNKLANAHKEGNTYALQTVRIYDKLTGAITGYEQQLVKSETGTVKLSDATSKAGGNLTKIAEETKKAEEAQKKWNEEVAKMKFQEKLALIEQQTKLMTAQIEGDAKKTVAAFEAISNTMSSTGEVLGDLFGLFKEFDGLSWSTQRKITDQIDKENKIREEAHNKLMERIDVEIAQMKAQTNALIKGDGLIKIDGAGLKPHLEAFMWEILQAIQVKVNADGLKLLLGA